MTFIQTTHTAEGSGNGGRTSLAIIGSHDGTRDDGADDDSVKGVDKTV